MKYICLINNIVGYTFPEIDPIRPTIPIEQLYSQEFLNQCIKVEDDFEVQSGWIYNPETKEFSAPIIIEEPITKDMESPIA